MTGPDDTDKAGFGGDEGEVSAIHRPCTICSAKVGDPCRDVGDETDTPIEGADWPRGVYHARRVFGGDGPILIEHTGKFSADGGGIFSKVVR